MSDSQKHLPGRRVAAAARVPAAHLLTGRNVMTEHELSYPLPPADACVGERALLAGFLAGIALALAACGGTTAPSAASSSPSSSPPPVSSQPSFASVTIQVTTSSGTPVAGAGVALNGGFDGRSADTDAAGIVRFADIPGGEATASAFARGFHEAFSRIVLTPDSNTNVTLILEHVAEATPVVLNSRAVPASDGCALTVDVDVAVLDEHGLAIPTLTAGDFTVNGSDCGLMWCVMDANGEPLSSGSYGARVDSEAFGWSGPAAEPPPPMAAALLLEQGTTMADFDPESLRLRAVNAFLESILPPDIVSLTTYRGTPPAPTLTTYGPFTSDGSQFRDTVNALGGQEAGTNPLYDALAEMLPLTETLAPSGANDPLPTIVLLASGQSWPDDGCRVYWTCSHQERLSVAATSRSLGIPIVVIGGSEPAADIAARTGGPSVVVHDPAQYAVVLGSLRAIAGRSLGFNRVRVVLDAGAARGAQAEPVFRSGHTVWANMSVRIGPNTRVGIPVVIPIQ
jgi:hypothetical protein